MLTQLKNVNKQTIAELKKAGWTIDTIATASPYQLAKVKGIGLKTAEGLIKDAQAIVNAQKLEESKIIMPGVIKQEPVQKSVRIRRIEESQK